MDYNFFVQVLLELNLMSLQLSDYREKGTILYGLNKGMGDRI